MLLPRAVPAPAGQPWGIGLEESLRTFQFQGHLAIGLVPLLQGASGRLRSGFFLLQTPLQLAVDRLPLPVRLTIAVHRRLQFRHLPGDLRLAIRKGK
jgi:hypothetical protein